MDTSFAPLFAKPFESEFPFPHPVKAVTTSNTPIMERILLLNICSFLLKIWSEKTVGKGSKHVGGCGSIRYFSPVSLSPGEFLRLVKLQKNEISFFYNLLFCIVVILLFT
jgi:hypothetical protein